MPLHILPVSEPFTLKCDNATCLVTLDGNRCKTEVTLLDELASVFRFPDYYGQNFDALYECLTDLEWLGVDKVYLLVIHPALICADETGEQPRQVFLDVLKDVMSAYRHHPIHFNLIAEKSFLHLLNFEPGD